MDQEYIKGGKGDWKLFQKRAILKESNADYLSNPEHPNASIGGSKGTFDGHDDFLTTYGKNIVNLANSPEYSSIVKKEKSKKDKAMYKLYSDFARDTTSFFDNAVEQDKTKGVLDLLDSYKQDMADASKESIAMSNKAADEFNKLVAEAFRKRGIGLSIGYLGFPLVQSTDGFRTFVVNAKEQGGSLLPHLLPDIARKLDVNNSGTLVEAPNLFGRAQVNGREKSNVSPVAGEDKIPDRVAAFAQWMKNNVDYSYWPKLVDLASQVFKNIRVANIYGAFAQGFKKRQEIIKAKDTLQQKELSRQIASGEALLLDPSEDTGFDKDTGDIIRHDFSKKPERKQAAEVDDTIDSEEMKKPIHPGVGKVDVLDKHELHEEIQNQDRRQSKLKKINEGWKRYAELNKNKKITGEGDKFNVAMG